jgi:hypothetical protein
VTTPISPGVESALTVEQRLASVEHSIRDLYARLKPLGSTPDSVAALNRAMDSFSSFAKRNEPRLDLVPGLEIEMRELRRIVNLELSKRIALTPPRLGLVGELRAARFAIRDGLRAARDTWASIRRRAT